MGWAYYEVSGGADFQPAETDTLIAQSQVAPEAEIVTRAQDTTLLTVSASAVAPVTAAPLAPAPQADIIQAVAVETTPVEDPAPVAVEVVDIREVGSSRVNMRSGPGTNFDVIVTLNSGTALEVIEVDESGWANVATVDRGIEGWMAERLLTAPDA